MISFSDQFNYDPETKSKCWYREKCKQKDVLCAPNEFCMKHYKMTYLIQRALMGHGLQYTIDLVPGVEKSTGKDDKYAFTALSHIQKDINEFVTDGRNVLIYSKNCGNGKTEWAKKLILSWFNTIWNTTDLTCRGLFISIDELFSNIKDSFNDKRVESIQNEYAEYVKANIYDTDVVVFDGLESRNLSVFERSFLTSILDKRYSASKTCIFTASTGLNGLAGAVGNPLASRIIDNSQNIEFFGPDRRSDKYKTGGNNNGKHF